MGSGRGGGVLSVNPRKKGQIDRYRERERDKERRDRDEIEREREKERKTGEAEMR